MNWVHRKPWKYVHLRVGEHDLELDSCRYVMACGKTFFLRGYIYFSMFKAVPHCPDCQRIYTMCELAE